MTLFKCCVLIIMSVIVSACSSSSWLLVPYEHKQQVQALNAPIAKREYLYSYPYRVMAVTRHEKGNIKAQQHFKAEHSLTFIWHPVSDSEGYHPADLLRIKDTRSLGFAVKSLPKQKHWNIFWYDKHHHHEGKGVEIYYLPEQPSETITKLWGIQE